ncbi:MAP1S isoform 10 [Pan troglodytes]|uniref:Microtubule associated protein 1S n=2 Tax=Homininae TaxID=207598 RepID=M0QXE8_HUMAN|nr:microtubule associated protein 1S [Homo sapiens]KAI4041299.1 microtubule associated protein 1S [Homo sapiens]PNI50588.1 MAP1S isoform 10 [Pan troglodytes]
MAAVAGSGAAAAPSSLLLVVGSEFGSPGLLTYVLEELERAQGLCVPTLCHLLQHCERPAEPAPPWRQPGDPGPPEPIRQVPV